jgi:hypothetical protein
MSSQSNLPLQLQQSVQSLQEAILSQHPRIPILLREIHTALRAQPENVTLASEEEIAIIVSGLKLQTGVEFAASATKSPTKAKSVDAKIKKLGADAF